MRTWESSRTDGQTQETTIPLWPERQRGKKNQRSITSHIKSVATYALYCMLMCRGWFVLCAGEAVVLYCVLAWLCMACSVYWCGIRWSVRYASVAVDGLYSGLCWRGGGRWMVCIVACAGVEVDGLYSGLLCCGGGRSV